MEREVREQRKPALRSLTTVGVESCAVSAPIAIKVKWGVPGVLYLLAPMLPCFFNMSPQQERRSLHTVTYILQQKTVFLASLTVPTYNIFNKLLGNSHARFRDFQFFTFMVQFMAVTENNR